MKYKFKNIYQLLSEISRQNKSHIAAFEDNKKLSYGELKNNVDKIANYLLEIKIKKGDKIGICLINSIEFLLAYYAITAIGAIAVPINTFLKSEEINYILNNCEAKVLFTQSSFEKELKSQIPGLNNIIWTDKICNVEKVQNSFLSDILANEKENNLKKYLLENEPNLDDLAHIIYTSGTTGKPKGAMLSYKNIFSNLQNAQDRFKIEKKDRFIVFLPMFHSFTLTVMILLPIFANASIVIIKSIFPFSNVLKQALLKRVSVFLGVPAIYTAIGKAKIPWYFRWFNNIRIFICGAAPLAKQTIDDFTQKFPKAKLIEGYGLSECSPIVATNLLEKQKLLSVGKAFDDHEIKIVDEEMIELKNGQIGEIIVKGDCVMKGYYGLSMEGDSSIINGWLRTGDLGKIDDEGFLYIVDRKKDLIISKGINIYPREIEEVIYTMQEVEAAAVIGIADKHADEEVVAFIQLKENMNLDEKTVILYLKKHLANFKIPKSVYFAQELPRNATGKVLKRILKEQIKDKF